MNQTSCTITQTDTAAVPSHSPWDRHQIKCVETGEIFDSAAAAAANIGCTKSAMSNHLAGRHPHVRGKHFVRVAEAQ